MQRSVLTGMMMLVPAPHPVKVFGGVPEAMQWLLPHVRALCGPTLRLEELTGALDQHLAEFQARADRPQVVLPG